MQASKSVGYKDKRIVGDSLQILKDFADNSIDLIITSPPYFQQRDYGNGNLGIGNEANEGSHIGLHENMCS